jgi:hypothetical protein
LALQRVLLDNVDVVDRCARHVGVHRDGDRLARRIGLRIESVSGARKERAFADLFVTIDEAWVA